MTQIPALTITTQCIMCAARVTAKYPPAAVMMAAMKTEMRRRILSSRACKVTTEADILAARVAMRQWFLARRFASRGAALRIAISTRAGITISSNDLSDFHGLS